MSMMFNPNESAIFMAIKADQNNVTSSYHLTPKGHMYYADVLTERYKIDVEETDTGYDLLEKAGRKRGFLMRGAQVDTERMARILLDEFRGGKLGRFTLETVEN